MTTPDLVAEGTNGQVELYDDRVQITRQGIVATVTYLTTGDREIPFDRLRGIQYKPPAGQVNGYVRFETPEAEAAFDPTDDPFTVSFDRSIAPNFERLREEVRERAALEEADVTVVDDETGDAALETLRERYAAGEIDRDEFERRRAVLHGEGPD